MASADHIGRKFWRWVITLPRTAKRSKRAAVSLWVTPSIMLIPLLLPLLEPTTIPAVLAGDWQVYAFFFVPPFALGALC